MQLAAMFSLRYLRWGLGLTACELSGPLARRCKDEVVVPSTRAKPRSGVRFSAVLGPGAGSDLQYPLLIHRKQA